MIAVRVVLAVMLMLFGLFSLLVSALGLFRFQNTLNRIHAAAVTDTIVVLSMMAGLALLSGLNVMTLKIGVIIVFMWLAGPVVTHFLTKTELLTGYDIDADEPHEEGETFLN